MIQPNQKHSFTPLGIDRDDLLKNIVIIHCGPYKRATSFLTLGRVSK